MDQAKEKVVCLYREKLNKTAKVWYLEKIKGIKGLDPYKHREWTADVNLLPNFSQANLYKYMLLGVSAYTHKVFINIRPVEQGHIQFTDGWVHDLKILKVEAKTIVRTKVNHSMRLSLKPLQPWVILKSCGEVESVHCTCMAGVAEKCVHVAALLYKIDTAVRLRGTLIPTDVSAYWLVPSNVNKVRGAAGDTIDYTTGAARKKALDQSTSGLHQSPSGLRTHVGEKVIPMRTLGDPKCTHRHYARSQVWTLFCAGGIQPHLCRPCQLCILPKSLLRLRNSKMDGCELSVLLKHCEGLRHLVAVTTTEAASLERKPPPHDKSNL
uniref:uncharacterized protein LOC117250755 n=1 Tax=Epinephelus lanceolatus TaxID=310571 RepID=UPI00144773CA|nr:uncharacterized protein LOC117250755 [Epinephelus lanceolatus]